MLQRNRHLVVCQLNAIADAERALFQAHRVSSLREIT